MKTTHLLTVRAEFDAAPSIGARSIVDVDGQRGALRAGAFYDLFDVERIYEDALQNIRDGSDPMSAADDAEHALDRADAVRLKSSLHAPEAPDGPVVPAAPDLLGALEAIVECWDGPKYAHTMLPNINRARAAIAAARGTSGANDAR